MIPFPSTVASRMVERITLLTRHKYHHTPSNVRTYHHLLSLLHLSSSFFFSFQISFIHGEITLLFRVLSSIILLIVLPIGNAKRHAWLYFIHNGSYISGGRLCPHIETQLNGSTDVRLCLYVLREGKMGMYI